MSVSLAQAGEDCAVTFLKQAGFRILKRNVRFSFGEIDIVAQEHDTLCFVEVKTRSGRQHGIPQEAVDWRKQQQLIRLANAFLQQEGQVDTVPVRFDVCAVTKQGATLECELLRGAFET